MLLFFLEFLHHRHLHSFPTRRSSDLARFEVAANKLGLEQGLYRYLKYPSKEITLYIPIGMDNGTLEVDRKSTRLNSSHEWISYAVFCLKKKKNITIFRHSTERKTREA